MARKDPDDDGNIARGPRRRRGADASDDPAPRKPDPKKAKAPAKKAKPPAKRASSKGTSSKAASPRRTRAAKAPDPAPPRSFRARLADAGRWLRAEAITWIVGASLGVLLAGVLLVNHARHDVRAWLESPAARPPTVVWSAPMRLVPGERVAVEDLVEDLLAAGLERAATLVRPGSVVVDGSTVRAWIPDTPGAAWRTGRAAIRLADGVVASVDPAAPLVLPPTRLAEIGDLGTRRDAADLDALPPHLPTALLAIEDARFRTHLGVDPIGIARALWSNLTSDGLQGGSTLTQQLAKNVFLSRERTWRRKVREVFYAVALELELDKQALLARYLSEVYLGHVGGRPLHGVEQAARAWFGRGATHLSLAQSATIVGAIASPNVYSPLRDPAAALRRRGDVLDRMVTLGALTHAEAEAARAEPLSTIAPPLTASWRLPWAVDAALAEVDAMLPPDAARDGLHVHTTIQPHWQRAAVTAVASGLAALPAEAADAEAALVAVDAATGDVRAIVGGRSYRDSPFPRATRARRQAGSTVKGLTALAALAADPVLSPASRVDDGPLTLRTDSGPWTPHNLDGQHLGTVSLTAAIADSRNLPAVRLARQVGWERLRDLFHRAGLRDATAYPSAALGAFEVTAWELAGAYTVFPGAGRVARPRIVTRIDDDSGALVRETPVSRTRLADAASAAMATALLQAVVTDGTGQRVADAGIRGPVGGKTGTSDDARDAWFVGFDGATSVAVWVGRDRGVPLGLGGGRAATPPWIAFAQAVGLPAAALPDAAGLTRVEVCADTGRPPCPGCAAVVPAWFRAGHVPTDPGPCGPAAVQDDAAPAPTQASPADPTRPRRRRDATPSLVDLPEIPD